MRSFRPSVVAIVVSFYALGCGRLGYSLGLTEGDAGGVADAAEATDAAAPDTGHRADASPGDARADAPSPLDSGPDPVDSGVEIDAAIDPTSVAEVRVGLVHTCARLAGGEVWCVGCNYEGNLGNGTSGPGSDSVVPVRSMLDSPLASALRTGDEHNCVVRSGAPAACWGWNWDGALATGTTERAAVPTEVVGLGDVVILEPARTATCAVVAGGAVRCVGDNFFGQLGDGTQTDRVSPVTVSGLSDVTDVRGAEGHFCALRSSGDVWCWGWGSSGQLGNGASTSYQTTPVQVSGIDDAVAIGVGHSHSCAIRSTGEVWCWGANDSGQLGDGTTTYRNVPGRVTGITGAAEVVGGYVNTCVRLISGEVRCFGWAGDGALGDGQLVTDRLTPVPVVDLADAVQISSNPSGGSVCALRATGEVVCWGNNDCGQLTGGPGSAQPSPVPFTGLP